MVWALPTLLVGVAIVLSLPLGRYLARIFEGQYRPPPGLARIEAWLNTGPQDWKQYCVALLLFNTFLFVLLFVLLALQPLIPFNPDGKGMLAPSTIFHTAASFVTNTTEQHYAGEQHMSYASQVGALLSSMFAAATVGYCALLAVVRGLRGDPHMGNYYVDTWRALVYVLLPSCLMVGALLLADGVPMTGESAAKISGDEGPNQEIARGPVAAMVPIKHLGTNGAGYFGASSAHPFEGPSAWASAICCTAMMLFPFALVIAFGRMLNQQRHAAILYGVMLVMLAGMIGWAVWWDTLHPNPALTAHEIQTYGGENGAPRIDVRPVVGLPVDQELGNLEGKELRFGLSAGPTFATVTTGANTGSFNCEHDSLHPLASLTPLLGLWLNCVFGSAGAGLIHLLIYLIVGVFFTGLMVGRTPEYLGKKVEAREMKLAMLALLIHPLLVLGPTGLFAATKWGRESVSNPGAHGFTQLLYEFSSAAANNGSGFDGLADTHGNLDNASPAPFAMAWDIATGLVMLLGRYVPIIAPIALAASLAAKKPTPFTNGTLRTDTLTFGLVLFGVVMLLGALLFLPAAVLGPVAEHLGPMPFQR
jgi:K+-transporting ATPase ATPase A chain